ncbi:hypothetical protein [Sinorhizobium medicae]|uniref:hypothetical protein n=1 Tax=Sinorhizobium medicae TaxID=110321 RepID=UPI000FDAD324|nr:hypothetical protein [Sinorhizobium medicae]MDX0434004.1 hypothetical protein [Sinorhizobium medicae]MDX0517069.1 hypothetical protein [Sinorhizobium medicae]MDX0524581.1 hypothetical protein [Sinorhizobium medicae]MDX0612410.1 hypothetical protein [Sinorhizobium medicae]MDX0652910.1 hypothetical protein [Sinorhizobium medicae]
MILEFWILCAIATAVIAAVRGGHSLFWLLIGCILGPIGIVAAIFVPSLKSKDPSVAAKRQGEVDELARPLRETDTKAVSVKSKDH